MKALLQRVIHAQVDVNGECAGKIEQGLLVFLGLDLNDDRATANRMLDKLLAYRMFTDESDRMNNSVADVGGGVLLISQFTLSAETRKGLRPGFSTAMPPGQALELYDYALDRLKNLHPKVASGIFGADMQVSLTNDGPVTFLLEI